MAKNKRSKKSKRCSSPGPGEYKKVDMNVVRSSAPEWTIKGKYPSKYGDCLPGPGKYDVKDNQPGSAYTIKSRPRTAKQEWSPGPGTYQGKF